MLIHSIQRGRGMLGLVVFLAYESYCKNTPWPIGTEANIAPFPLPLLDYYSSQMIRDRNPKKSRDFHHFQDLGFSRSGLFHSGKVSGA